MSSALAALASCSASAEAAETGRQEHLREKGGVAGAWLKVFLVALSL